MELPFIMRQDQRQILTFRNYLMTLIAIVIVFVVLLSTKLIRINFVIENRTHNIHCPVTGTACNNFAKYVCMLCTILYA